MNAQFLAFDLGAESGRAVVGELAGATLSVRETRRFANQPVRKNGGILQWDILRLWQEMRATLEAAPFVSPASGVDAWGVILLSSASVATCSKPLSLPRCPHRRRHGGGDDAVTREHIYGVTGVQFLPFNTLYQLYAACRLTPRLIDSAARWRRSRTSSTTG